MYVCMYVCMYYVCMYIYIYIYESGPRSCSVHSTSARPQPPDGQMLLQFAMPLLAVIVVMPSAHGCYLIMP